MLNFKVIFIGSVLSRHNDVQCHQIWWECGLEGPFGALQLVPQYKDVRGAIVEVSILGVGAFRSIAPCSKHKSVENTAGQMNVRSFLCCRITHMHVHTAFKYQRWKRAWKPFAYRWNAVLGEIWRKNVINPILVLLWLWKIATVLFLVSSSKIRA